MGIDPTTALMIAQLGSAGIGGLLQSDPYQHRESFTGTGADPTSWLSDVRASLGNVLGAATNRANEDVNVGGNVDLSPSPTFSDPSLPWNISGPQMTAPKRVSVSGFNIGPVGNGSASSLPVSAWTGGRTPANTPQNKAEARTLVKDKLVDNPALPDWYRKNIGDQMTATGMTPDERTNYIQTNIADNSELPSWWRSKVGAQLPPAAATAAPTTMPTEPGPSSQAPATGMPDNPGLLQAQAAARLLQHALGVAA